MCVCARAQERVNSEHPDDARTLGEVAVDEVQDPLCQRRVRRDRKPEGLEVRLAREWCPEERLQGRREMIEGTRRVRDPAAAAAVEETHHLAAGE